jgi:hypothetical protein
VTYKLSFREPGRNVGGAVFKGWLQVRRDGQWRDVEPSAFRMATRGADVTFLIHGFNVSRDEALAMYDKLEPMLARIAEEDLIVTVLWPGDSKFGFLSFSVEGRDADDTGLAFIRFLEDYVAPDAGLNFASHSLGARVVMETVDRVRTARPNPVGQVCLTAPAIDSDSLTHPAKYIAAVASLSRVAVLSSKRDRVLKWAYPLGDLLESFLFASADGAHSALGRKGPKKDSTAPPAIWQRIYSTRIPKKVRARHADYFPGQSDISGKHQSTAEYVCQTVLGDLAPDYPLPPP